MLARQPRSAHRFGPDWVPVTVQWLAPDGKIGWIQLTNCPPIDASADRSGISISTTGDVSFRISAPANAENTAQTRWSLPGLTVQVEADATGFAADQHGPFVDLAYRSLTKMRMTFSQPAALE